MFERFTERARQVVVLAQQAAREHDGADAMIETPHVLLGCILEAEGLAARVLDRLDVTEGNVRSWMTSIGYGERRAIGGSTSGTNHERWSPEAKKVLEYALREALALGHNYIGTEHILLGIVKEPNITDEILLADKTRDETMRMLGTNSPRVPYQSPSKDRPLTVSFEIIEGQVWIDPDEVSWYVRHIDGDTVHLDRTVVTEIKAMELVRKWRQVAKS